MKLVTNNQQSDSEQFSAQIPSHVSAMVDGELTSAEVKAHIPTLISVGRERQKWQSYHLVRDLLQQQLPDEHNRSFTQKVMSQLESEPTILAPVRSARTLAKQLIGVGLAASVAAVALLSSYVMNHSGSEGIQPAHMIADAQTAQKIQKSSKDLVDVEQWKRAPDLAQVMQDPDLTHFSSYLANHAAYSAGSGKQGFMPYARVVGYGSEK